MSSPNRIAALWMGVLQKLRRLDWFPVLLVRICLGLEFFVSGKGKLADIDHLITAFEGWNIPLPGFQAPFVATIELVGGLCLILGLGTRIFAALLAGTMAVALLVILTQENVTSLAFETVGDFLYLPEVGFLLMFGWLVFTGPGRVSADHYLAPRLGLDPGTGTTSLDS